MLMMLGYWTTLKISRYYITYYCLSCGDTALKLIAKLKSYYAVVDYEIESRDVSMLFYLHDTFFYNNTELF